MEWLTKDEYFEWLKENRNKEEAAAEKVVEEILKLHDAKHWYGSDNYTPYFKPRHVIVVDIPFKKDKVHIEFDLLILLKHDKHDGFNKTIAVEFKETDSTTVVKQAIVRRLYTDYVYIALKRYAYIKPEDVLLLTYYGIGWIMWDIEPEKFAYPIFPAAYKWRTNSPNFNMSYLIHASMRDWINFEIKRVYEENLKNKKVVNLFSFGGEEDGE